MHMDFAQNFAYIYLNLTSIAGPEAERIDGKLIFRGETVGMHAVIVIASSCSCISNNIHIAAVADSTTWNDGPVRSTQLVKPKWRLGIATGHYRRIYILRRCNDWRT